MKKTTLIASTLLLLTALVTPTALAENEEDVIIDWSFFDDINWDWFEDEDAIEAAEDNADPEVVEEVIAEDEIVIDEEIDVIAEAAAAEAAPEPVEPSLSEKLARAHYTTQVVEREPVDNIEVLYSDLSDEVFFFVDVRECVTCEMVHQWVFNGEIAYERPATVTYPRFRWWSGKTNLIPGTWTVNVKLNGEVVGTYELEYVEATQQQIQQAPIEYQVRKRAISKCEQELEYWYAQLEEDPDEEYLQWQVDRWESQCSVK